MTIPLLLVFNQEAPVLLFGEPIAERWLAFGQLPFDDQLKVPRLYLFDLHHPDGCSFGDAGEPHSDCTGRPSLAWASARLNLSCFIPTLKRDSGSTLLLASTRLKILFKRYFYP